MVCHNQKLSPTIAINWMKSYTWFDMYSERTKNIVKIWNLSYFMIYVSYWYYYCLHYMIQISSFFDRGGSENHNFAGMESHQCPYQSWASLTPVGWKGLLYLKKIKKYFFPNHWGTCLLWQKPFTCYILFFFFSAQCHSVTTVVPMQCSTSRNLHARGWRGFGKGHQKWHVWRRDTLNICWC